MTKIFFQTSKIIHIVVNFQTTLFKKDFTHADNHLPTQGCSHI